MSQEANKIVMDMLHRHHHLHFRRWEKEGDEVAWRLATEIRLLAQEIESLLRIRLGVE